MEQKVLVILLGDRELIALRRPRYCSYLEHY